MVLTSSHGLSSFSHGFEMSLGISHNIPIMHTTPHIIVLNASQYFINGSLELGSTRLDAKVNLFSSP